jgi:hypothetical protein
MDNDSVHHTTVIYRQSLPDAYDPKTTPQVGELDELKTFVGSKRTGYGQP